jgi:hypothetical protein
MSLDELLLELRARRLVLISESEIWDSPRLTCAIKRAVRRHRRGLRELLRYSSISVCCSPPWHRRHWRYDGSGRFICEVCEQIAV